DRDPEGIEDIELVEAPHRSVVAERPLAVLEDAQVRGGQERDEEEPDDDGERRRRDGQAREARGAQVSSSAVIGLLENGLSGNERPFLASASGGTSWNRSARALSDTCGSTCWPSMPGYQPFRSTMTRACVSGEVMNSTYFRATLALAAFCGTTRYIGWPG